VDAVREAAATDYTEQTEVDGLALNISLRPARQDPR
jgi:hypothetical protein